MGSLIGFVDSGYLKAEGARALSSGDAGGRVRLDAGRVVEWIRDLASSELIDEPFLRCYWYDGAFDPNDQRSVSQRRYFDAIASTPGLSLRLGHLVERQDRHRAGIERALERFGIDPVEFSRVHDYRRPEVTQKGVETLMVTDLLSAAFRSQMSTAVVMAGDRDLAEALRVVQEQGTRVVLAVPESVPVAAEVRHLADELVTIGGTEMATMLQLQRETADAS